MDAEEIRWRSTYLFLTCARVVEQLAGRLIATFPDPPLYLKLTMERSLKRELGLLARYWATRQIWEALEAKEADAKQLNVAILRLFTQAFSLPRDGSGLRYAELATLGEQTRELHRRVVAALDREHAPLLAELQRAIGPSRELVAHHTTHALELPLERIIEQMKTDGGVGQPGG